MSVASKVRLLQLQLLRRRLPFPLGRHAMGVLMAPCCLFQIQETALLC